MTLPIGHKHTHTITRGGNPFRKDKPTKCDYCETESYWRERIAREIEVLDRFTSLHDAMSHQVCYIDDENGELLLRDEVLQAIRGR